MGATRPNPAVYLADMIAKASARQMRIAAMWAYFDETIVREQQLLVGGCISSKTKWDQLAKKWRKALRDEKVSVFHAKDFYQFRRQFEWYKDGQKDWDRHASFRDRLADIITEFTDEAIAFSSDISVQQNGRAKIKGAYKGGALHALNRLTWRQDRPYIIFADHPEVSSWLLLDIFKQMNWDNRLGGCGVFDAREVEQLQAADYVMNALNKEWHNTEGRVVRTDGTTVNPAQDRLEKGYRARGKMFSVQLGSSRNSSEMLGAQPA